MAEVLYHKQGIFGRKLELHIAPEGLTLVGLGAAGSVDFAPIADVAGVSVAGRGRRATLNVSFGPTRPAWTLTGLQTSAAQWAEAVINEEMQALRRKQEPLFSRLVPLNALADTCQTILSERDGRAVVDLADFILVQGVLHEASDVHFDPYSENVVIRFRLDGVLQDVLELDSGIKSRLTSRLKVLSRLATFKKHVAQEGRAAVGIGERTVDFRFSAIPTIHGEKIAVRIFDPAKSIFGITDLGMTDQMLSSFQDMLLQPQGTILLTGPAGSGKTTTMYSAVNYLRENKKNLSSIATVEDPVEYDLQVVNQTQINEHTGLTFANALRTVLRQDPEVIMIGEIRDRETADIAVQAGLTGHLILSTVHARSAAGVPLRLLDLGVEPYLLTSSLTGIISQRLVRCVCKSCAQAAEPSAEEREVFDLTPQDSFVKGSGCEQCNGTGYSGRTGIFQFVPMFEEARDLISRRCSITDTERAFAGHGVRSLADDGLDKARNGITTLEELTRVLGRNQT